MLKGYVVRGINPKSGKLSRYGTTETPEGAEMLAEEAIRMGWLNVTWQSEYMWDRY